MDIVTTLAHKSGGAHVDPEIDEEYEWLLTNPSLGWIVHRSDGEAPMKPPLMFVSMRQIAYELARTIEPEVEKIRAR
jgi:hypothetical protein